MTDCTATLTTATVEDCPDAPYSPHASTLEQVCMKGKHITLHTFKCGRHDPEHPNHARHWSMTQQSPREYMEWTDTFPGATSHKPPLVTEREVSAACRVLPPEGGDLSVAIVRAALEAAAKVRMEDE